jgi:hypothetical protein
LGAELGVAGLSQELPPPLGLFLLCVDEFAGLLLLLQGDEDLLRGEGLEDVVLDVEDVHAEFLLEGSLEFLGEVVDGVQH